MSKKHFIILFFMTIQFFANAQYIDYDEFVYYDRFIINGNPLRDIFSSSAPNITATPFTIISSSCNRVNNTLDIGGRIITRTFTPNLMNPFGQWLGNPNIYDIDVDLSVNDEFYLMNSSQVRNLYSGSGSIYNRPQNSYQGFVLTSDLGMVGSPVAVGTNNLFRLNNPTWSPFTNSIIYDSKFDDNNSNHIFSVGQDNNNLIAPISNMKLNSFFTHTDMTVLPFSNNTISFVFPGETMLEKMIQVGNSIYGVGRIVISGNPGFSAGLVFKYDIWPNISTPIPNSFKYRVIGNPTLGEIDFRDVVYDNYSDEICILHEHAHGSYYGGVLVLDPNLNFVSELVPNFIIPPDPFYHFSHKLYSLQLSRNSIDGTMNRTFYLSGYRMNEHISNISLNRVQSLMLEMPENGIPIYSFTNPQLANNFMLSNFNSLVPFDIQNITSFLGANDPYTPKLMRNFEASGADFLGKYNLQLTNLTSKAGITFIREKLYDNIEINNYSVFLSSTGDCPAHTLTGSYTTELNYFSNIEYLSPNGEYFLDNRGWIPITPQTSVEIPICNFTEKQSSVNNISDIINVENLNANAKVSIINSLGQVIQRNVGPKEINLDNLRENQIYIVQIDLDGHKNVFKYCKSR